MTPILTTREYIATHLLAGLMTSEPYDKEHLVGIAIEATDELLRQLEETEKARPFQKPNLFPNRSEEHNIR